MSRASFVKIATMSHREKYPKEYFPFSDEICTFMDLHPCFHDSLKLAETGRFTFLRVILTSFLPHDHLLHNDEVIGLFYYDEEEKLFKQDFIVNKNNEGKLFYSYVASCIKNKYHSCDFVFLIDDFFETYGSEGKYYHRDNNKKPWMHHYKDINELPKNDDLRKCARDILDRPLKRGESVNHDLV
jgi:hypothetical protein